MARLSRALPGPLLDWLKAGRPALLVTTGADGYPHTAFTWALALSPDRVRVAVDLGSTTLGNLEQDGRAALQVIGEAGVYLLKGAARVVRGRVAASPFPMALWELQVEEVRDQSWPGVRVHPLAYTWQGEEREAMRAAEAAILDEMRLGP